MNTTINLHLNHPEEDGKFSSRTYRTRGVEDFVSTKVAIDGTDVVLYFQNRDHARRFFIDGLAAIYGGEIVDHE